MPEGDKHRPILNSGIVKKIREGWPDISKLGLLVTFLALVISLYQLRLARKEVEVAVEQFRFEQMQRPSLEYNYYWATAYGSEKESTSRLMRNFCEQIQERETFADVSYPEVLDFILPMTMTVTAKETYVAIWLYNAGSTTANKARVFIRMNQPIVSYQVKSLEPFQEIDYGEGENELVLEVDRIVADATVEIVVKPRIDLDTTLGQIIFDAPNPDHTLQLGPGITFPWPSVEYVEAELPELPEPEVIITFDGGKGTRKEKFIRPILPAFP